MFTHKEKKFSTAKNTQKGFGKDKGAYIRAKIYLFKALGILLIIHENIGFFYTRNMGKKTSKNVFHTRTVKCFPKLTGEKKCRQKLLLLFYTHTQTQLWLDHKIK